MTTPTIVQSAFARGTGTTTLTAVLASAPTVGNAIMTVSIGYGPFNSPLPPYSMVTVAPTFNGYFFGGVWVTYGKVLSASSYNYSISPSSGSGSNQLAIFEIQNARLDVPSDSSYITQQTPSTAAITTPALATAADSGGLRFAVMAWYGAGGIPTPNPPTGWTLLTPTSWMSATLVGNGAIWLIPNSSTGSQSLTFSTSVSYLNYVDLQVMQASTGSLVIPRADLASSKPAYVGKAISSPVTTTAQKAGFQSTTNAFYGSGEYLGQWSPAAASKSISGTIVENGLPVSKLVRLMNRVTNDFIAQMYSNPSTGAFSFTGLNPAITYQVVAFDSPQFNAQIYDNLIPG